MRNSTKWWWWIFGLLVALPALILAVLGLRAIRAERIERDDLLRRQQRSVARQIDQAIAELTDGVARGLNGSSTFYFDRQGLAIFPSEKVYFGEFGLRPASLTVLNDWSPSLRQGIEQARAAEAQQLHQLAANLYGDIARAEPTLRDWAAFSKTRIRKGSGVDAVLKRSHTGDGEYARGLTPTGLPVAVLASLDVMNLPKEVRSPFLPAVEQILLDLYDGAWWLSGSERQFYGEALRDVIRSIDPSRRPADDEKLQELTRIDRAVRQSPPNRTDQTTHSFSRVGRDAYLIVWTPDEDPDRWIGTAVSDEELSQQLDDELAKLLMDQPFKVEVREAEGMPISGSVGDGTEVWHIVGSRAMPDWEFAFTGPITAGLLPAQMLWYGLIGLVLIVLSAGIVMTARVVRKEMELSRLQEELIAAVSHEFKSPITGVRLLTERLAGGRALTQEQAAKYYEIIRQELNRLERLVNRLLGTQRAQSEELGARSARAIPIELAEEAAALLLPQAEEKNIQIIIESDDQRQPVLVDRPAVIDAIENLLDNALKYSPSDSTVKVAIKAQDDAVRIEVTDMGTGIDRDEQKRIFDKFYRVPTSGELDARGTGLGLALVKAVAEAHGGSVNVESEPGAGSKFSLILPVIQEETGHGTDSHRG